jgi:restriction system protein
MYYLEGQVESVTFELANGPNVILRCFGSDYEFVVLGTLVNINVADVIKCEITSLTERRFQIRKLWVADKTVYTSYALVTNPEDLICTADDTSINFRNVLAEIRNIELELIKYLKTHPERLRELHSDAFEKLVAEIFAANGYEAQWTGRCRDTAADVIAVRRTVSLDITECYIIECKRYAEKRPVGVDVARALYGAVLDENRTGGILVTTSRFESGVYEFANSKWNFHIKHYDDLKKWLQNYLPQKNGRLYMGQVDAT